MTEYGQSDNAEGFRTSRIPKCLAIFLMCPTSILSNLGRDGYDLLLNLMTLLWLASLMVCPGAHFSNILTMSLKATLSDIYAA